MFNGFYSGYISITRKLQHRKVHQNFGFVYTFLPLGMGRTWEKFSSLPAKKPQKFETATGKGNF